MSKVYIVIPHYQNWHLTHARLWELYKYCRKDIEEVIVVDDCSLDDETRGGLKWWAEFEHKYEFRVTSIVVEENLGFLKASNLGIHSTCMKIEEEDILVLLSNDVEIRTNFVSQIRQIISQAPDSLVGGILYSHDTGWNKFGDRLFPYIEGWLLAMSKYGWNCAEFGFDERFAPNDYEDVDLSTSMLEMGFDLIPLNNPGLHHIGGQSIGYSQERLTQTIINKKKFEDKWMQNQKETSES